MSFAQRRALGNRSIAPWMSACLAASNTSSSVAVVRPYRMLYRIVSLKRTARHTTRLAVTFVSQHNVHNHSWYVPVHRHSPVSCGTTAIDCLQTAMDLVNCIPWRSRRGSAWTPGRQQHACRAPNGALRHFHNVLAVDGHGAALHVIEPEQQPQQRRLAAAGGTHLGTQSYQKLQLPDAAQGV